MGEAGKRDPKSWVQCPGLRGKGEGKMPPQIGFASSRPHCRNWGLVETEPLFGDPGFGFRDRGVLASFKASPLKSRTRSLGQLLLGNVVQAPAPSEPPHSGAQSALHRPDLDPIAHPRLGLWTGTPPPVFPKVYFSF